LSKIRPDFSKKGVLKLKLPKNYFTKKCAPILQWKKCRKIQMFFDIHFESPILALRNKVTKLSKASQNSYNRGGWLILQDFLKNWVAKVSLPKLSTFVEIPHHATYAQPLWLMV
jgi:hypothetical protein